MLWRLGQPQPQARRLPVETCAGEFVHHARVRCFHSGLGTSGIRWLGQLLLSVLATDSQVRVRADAHTTTKPSIGKLLGVIRLRFRFLFYMAGVPGLGIICAKYTIVRSTLFE